MGNAIVGGVLIGIAASALWLLLGRVAGISGILGRLLEVPDAGDRLWRVAFLAGLPLGASLCVVLGAAPAITYPVGGPLLGLAGLLVGFGTRLGSGCTSGHGVCGIARGSRRSIVATVVFMVTAMATVALVRHVVGGAL